MEAAAAAMLAADRADWIEAEFSEALRRADEADDDRETDEARDEAETADDSATAPAPPAAPEAAEDIDIGIEADALMSD